MGVAGPADHWVALPNHVIPETREAESSGTYFNHRAK
jgi:hypothetical protein